MGERLAITGVTLVDGGGGDPLERAVVVVEDGTIAAAGAESEVPVDREARVLDAAGGVLMPGTIDAHCHLGGASYPDEDRWVLEDDRYQAIASAAQAREMLRHGVTSARDISVNGTRLRTAIDRGLISGPRIVPCWRGLSRRGGHGDARGVPPEMVRTSHPWGLVADGPDEVRAGVREVVKQGGQCVKVWASGGGLHENEPEDVQHYSLAELRVIVEEANYARVPVAAHCECASAARDAAEAGVWSIEHGEDLDAETIALMAEKGISLNPTLVLLTQWLEQSSAFGGPYGKPYIPGVPEPPDDTDELRRLLHERLSANLMAAKAAGVRIGVGSDAYCTGLTPFGRQTLQEVHALAGAGLSEMEAVVAATRAGAEILRIEEITGTIEPGKAADLRYLRAVGSTGSPLAIESYEWIWRVLPKVGGPNGERRIWLNPISGGTDFAGAFVGGMPTLPVVAGEMQCRCLGADVHAWSEPGSDGRGRDLIDEVGELVCTKPMPSMPLYFWGDQPAGPNGRRYHDSYFDMYPGIWRHGDWIRITPRGGAIIYGRSDATINRHGIRMGTAELYRAVEVLPEVLDSIVVDLEYLGRESYMPLFVVLRDNVALDDALAKRIRQGIKAALSARHVPNEIFQVSAVPRTLSGKKMELPLKKLLMGTPADAVFKLDAMANADCVAWFVEFAQRRGAPRSG